MPERKEEMRIDGPAEGHTLFLPPMEPVGARLMGAVFRAYGYNAEVLPEDEETLALGYKHTGGGECVPCPCTVGSLVKEMRGRDLDPAKVVFFMPTACGPCRFGQYARLDRIIFEKLGWGGIRIMSPSAENAYAGLQTAHRKNLWHAIIVSDIMRKLGLKIRPYEREKGQTDRVIEEGLKALEAEFEKPGHQAGRILASVVEKVAAIPVTGESKPLVGVVGEIYVRSDPFINMNLLRRIEELGGEAMLAPISEWILYTQELQGLIERERGGSLLARVRIWLEKHAFFQRVEHTYYKIARPVLHDREEPPITEVMAEGLRYFPWEFEGEAGLTIGRAALYVKKEGAHAIVNASPMFCMPGTVTTSVFPKLEEELGVPVICNFYDGSGDPNQSLVPMMHYLREKVGNAP